MNFESVKILKNKTIEISIYKSNFELIVGRNIYKNV